MQRSLPQHTEWRSAFVEIASAMNMGQKGHLCWQNSCLVVQRHQKSGPRPSCCTACALRTPAGEVTQDHLPPICQQSSKAHKITTELPSNWYSNATMNKPLSLVRYNYVVACKMHTCSSGKCHTTQLATNTVIIFLLLNGTLLLCPHRLRHMRPRCIGLIPSLPTNTKLSKVEQNTHMAMQLRCRARPHIAGNPPLPQVCKEVLHPCVVEGMDLVIFLLGFTQSCPPNIRYNSVQAALRGAIMSTYFKIEELSIRSRRTTLIPNHNIRRGSWHKVAYPYSIPKIVQSHGYLIYMACVLGIEKDI